MLIVRTAHPEDLPALEALAHSSGGGLTTLPLDREVLARKLQRADIAFRTLQHHGEGLFLFVLEDTRSGKVVGVSGIETAVGLTQPWYTYSVGLIVHASTELDIHHRYPTLFLTNDHTGCSELCSLFLHHLDGDDVVRVLHAMRSAAKRRVVISDLMRTNLGYVLAKWGIRLLTSSPVCHVDGPLSVKAALTISEARCLAERAGWTRMDIRRNWPERFLMVCDTD